MILTEEGIRHGKTGIIDSMVINSDRRIKCARSLITQPLLASWHSVLKFLEWHSSSEREKNKIFAIKGINNISSSFGMGV